uniref:Uncharacterized protein n=1 Tax=Phenylobacterium glaciei TaxID=2803784 RepID=A0A974P5T0_9CAUL|nr:hypothetical protein JKL49_11215 [Phenylobacterium glaciei]
MVGELERADTVLRASQAAEPTLSDPRLDSVPLSAIGDAEAAIAGDAAMSVGPEDRRLRDLLSLAIGIALDLLPVQLEPHLKG